ncbi:outer membrane protein [Sphingomonas sp.]|uniref:outer membrane protein n=1 Tax=Sphingomonas sp. TaxID=28214 RepID=UPI002EDA1B83
MRMRTLLGAATGALALAVAAAPAYAQDAPDGDEFTGFHVGGSVGYTVQKNDVGESILFDAGRNGSFGDTITTADGGNAFAPGFCNGAATSSANIACRNDKDDIEYYARLGFDKQMGKVVIGAVAEFGKSEASDSVSAFSTTPAFYTMTRELDWNAALRLRGGYTVGPKTLLYATGGGAYAKIGHKFATSNTANSFEITGDDNAWGWQAGGGLEQKLGRNFSVGVEYLYSRYDDDNSGVTVGTGTAGATNPFVLAGGADFARSQNRFDFHSLRATAAFRF